MVFVIPSQDGIILLTFQHAASHSFVDSGTRSSSFRRAGIGAALNVSHSLEPQFYNWTPFCSSVSDASSSCNPQWAAGAALVLFESRVYASKLGLQKIKIQFCSKNRNSILSANSLCSHAEPALAHVRSTEQFTKPVKSIDSRQQRLDWYCC